MTDQTKEQTPGWEKRFDKLFPNGICCGNYDCFSSCSENTVADIKQFISQERNTLLAWVDKELIGEDESYMMGVLQSEREENQTRDTRNKLKAEQRQKLNKLKE